MVYRFTLVAMIVFKFPGYPVVYGCVSYPREFIISMGILIKKGGFESRELTIGLNIIIEGRGIRNQTVFLTYHITMQGYLFLVLP